MKVAIAGLGGAARRGHLPALEQLGERASPVGAADLVASHREAFSCRYPTVPVYASAEEMLTHVTCDVVVIATHPQTHAALVVSALDRGFDVVCEKPLVVDRAHHRAVARACARHPDLALVPVHQYRYTPQWASIARWARHCVRLGWPFTLDVEVHRRGTDRYASSPWRSDINATGGTLADAGVHFLALAWTLTGQLEAVAADRRRDGTGRERASAILRSGPGVLTIQAWNAAPERRTRVVFRTRRCAIVWDDDTATVLAGPRVLRCRRVRALSDRSHVDSLYVALYGDIVARLHDRVWRERRRLEALGVGATLVTLLEHASASADVDGVTNASG